MVCLSRQRLNSFQYSHGGKTISAGPRFSWRHGTSFQFEILDHLVCNH